MLSKDELAGGKTFVLRLWGADGTPSQWVETLRGADAERWYAIYRFADWRALRAEAAHVFRHPATADEADRAVESGECVYIHTPAVRTEDLA
jgi:hypothetical protein